MMTNLPNRDQLTVDDLRAYQAGLLTGAARHRVEQLLLEQPFYADALAGLEALQQTGASLPAHSAQLRTALHRRVRESATKRRLWPLWLTTAIAAIILVLCIAIYLIFFTKPAKPARQLPDAKSVHQVAHLSVLPAGLTTSKYHLAVAMRPGRPAGEVYQQTKPAGFGAQVQAPRIVLLKHLPKLVVKRKTNQVTPLCNHVGLHDVSSACWPSAC